MNKVQNIFIPPMQLANKVVAEFDQQATAEISLWPGGFCAALTLHWLSLRLLGQNWPATQADPRTTALATAASATYATYKAHQTVKDDVAVAVFARGIFGNALGLVESVPEAQIRRGIESVAGGLGLAIDGDAIAWGAGTDGHVFMHETAVLKVGLYYLSMRTKMPTGDDQAHAVGLQIYESSTDTDCEYYDSNLGQFHFEQPSDFRWAFYDLLKAYETAYGHKFYRGTLFRMKAKV